MDNCRLPGELSFDGNLEENWKRFSQAFDFYLCASEKDKKDGKVKCALLLNCAGEHALEVYNSFTFTAEEKDKYEVLKKKFSDHMTGKKDLSFERQKFWSRTQKEGEQFINYLSELRKQAKNCEFGDLTEGLIRDRIVRGVRNHKTTEKLMSTSDLTYETAVKICKADELNQNRLREMTDGMEELEVAAVQKTGASAQRGRYSKQQWRGRSNKQRYSSNHGHHSSSDNKCPNCGNDHGDEDRCPAKGYMCYKCKGMDHYKRCCKLKHVNQVSRKNDYYEEESDSNEEFIVMSVEKQQGKQRKTWHEMIKVKGILLPMKLDTGSEVNLLSYKDYKAMKDPPKIKQTDARCTDYNGNIIDILGSVRLTVGYKKIAIKTTFLVCADEARISLMGAELCENMGLVKRIRVVGKNNDFLEEYEDLFKGLGCLPGEVKIQLQDPEPVVEPCRSVPFGKRDMLKVKIDEMEKAGVIAKLKPNETSQWVNSMHIVYKADGSLRVVLDPRNLNKYILREHFKIPTREEIMSRMSGATVFSKLDCTKGFWQMKLDEASSYLCVFNSPFGRYRYLRLPFGLNSAPEIFHTKISAMFEDLPQVATYIDDIIVWGKDKKEHDEVLTTVFERCKEMKLSLNRDKCEIGVDSLAFIGDIISSEGVKPDPRKVEAIRKFETPKCKEDVARFLGMTKYLARFIPQLSDQTITLRNLTKPSNEFTWNNNEQAEFTQLKTIISEKTVLKFYDGKKPLRISCDASKIGLGAVLEQEEEDGWQPVAYASKSLNACQAGYANIERETLAIAFACERFHQYIFGIPIVVRTDHKPLVSIFRKGLNDCPPRIQRLRLSLEKYDIKVEHIPGKDMSTADALSRASVNSVGLDIDDQIEEHAQELIEAVAVADVRREEIKRKYEEDNTMIQLRNYIVFGWPEKGRNCHVSLKDYYKHRDELTIVDGLILKGCRIVIPSSLRESMIEKLHAGHLGQSKCINRARKTIFWPGITQDIIKKVEQCGDCEIHHASQVKEPLMPQPIPDEPWSKVGADLCSHENSNYLVLVDYTSGYPDVYKIKDSKSETVVQAMKSAFGRFGVPMRLMTDNGPCFSGEVFARFVQEWDIQHVTSSPTYARSNGLAEKSVAIVKNIIKKPGDVSIGLLAYRTTPIVNGLSPAQILFGRQPRTNLPSVPEKPTELLKETVEMKRMAKLKQKDIHDKHAKPLRPLEIGEKVRLRPIGDSKWLREGVIIDQVAPRSYDVKTDFGRILRRNRKDLLISKVPLPLEERQTEDTEPYDLEPGSNPCPDPIPEQPDIRQQDQPTPRRSSRVYKPTKRLIEEA